jgi:hypothetical protein
MAGNHPTIPCCSVFSLGELSYRREVFERYLDTFSVLPSVVLDGYQTLFEKEVAAYDENKEVDVLLVVPFAISAPGLGPRARLAELMRIAGLKDRFAQWKNAAASTLDGILELRKNYPPDGPSYTKREVEDFVFIATTTQIRLRDRQFAEAAIGQDGQIYLDRFPSVLATSYVVFYKFYPDERKPRESDVIDILISSTFPYVDNVITEGNLCDIMRKTQRRHSFLLNIEFTSVSEFKKRLEEDSAAESDLGDGH